MNETLKENERKLLSLFSQLLVVVALIQIITLWIVENPNSNFLWVVFSGLVGLVAGVFVFAESNRKLILNKWILLLLGIICVVIYVLALNHYYEPRMYIGLFLSTLISLILLLK